jgi:hypothetical protein
MSPVKQSRILRRSNPRDTSRGMSPPESRRRRGKHGGLRPEIDRGAGERGRTAIVAGANASIGWETARVLALHGAHVVMACRDPERAKSGRERIVSRRNMQPSARSHYTGVPAARSTQPCGPTDFFQTQPGGTLGHWHRVGAVLSLIDYGGY